MAFTKMTQESYGTPAQATSAHTEHNSSTHTADDLKKISVACLAAAQEYAAYGWRVVPIYGLRTTPHGALLCTCPKGNDCPSPGKHPRLEDWPNKATTDEATIGQWWEQYPNSQVGIVLGEASGIIDIECDDAAAERKLLELFGGELPMTPTYKSRRGSHRLFRYRDDLPDGGRGVYKPADCKALEFRTGKSSKGMQSVAPPSMHAGIGKQYQWVDGLSPAECEVAELPDAVVAKLWNEQGRNGELAERQSSFDPAIADGVSEGNRNNAAASFIGKLLQNAKQLDESILWPVVCAWNQQNKPPLSESELRNVFASIMQAERRQRSVSESLNGVPSDDPPPDYSFVDDQAATQSAEPAKKITYRVITAAQLDSEEFKTEWIVENTLVADQPCIVAGVHKGMKTSLMCDMTLSIGRAVPFMGVDAYSVPESRRVALMTGESGLATVQETMRRIAAAKGFKVCDANFIVSDDLPKFGQLEHHKALTEFLTHNEVNVLIVDPVYLCMPGADAGNVFMQGERLLHVGKVARDCGVTPILVHHAKKSSGADGEPLELSDIAWAGFAEFARQWLLVSRREKFVPGSGEHRLWLACGGSAGHSWLRGVDIYEGVGTDRVWDVSTQTATEAISEKQRQKERTKCEKQRQAEADDVHELRKALKRCPEGETINGLRGQTSLNHKRLCKALGVLIDEGRAAKCKVLKNKRQEDGYKPTQHT